MNKQALSVLLAVLGLQHKDVAHHTGYAENYVRQVMAGHGNASRNFRASFFDLVDSMVFGDWRKGDD